MPITQFLLAHLWDIIYGFLGIIVFALLLFFLKKTIRVASPDRVLVVTGRRAKRQGRSFGFKVHRGKAFVLPYLQSMDTLSLEVIPIDIRVDGINSANGITVGADAAACVCVDSDDEGQLYGAVERLMGKTPERIAEQAKQILVGNFRAALNKATPLQAIGMEPTERAVESVGTVETAGTAETGGARAAFHAELLAGINADLRSFGMKAVSVSLQKIWDSSGYIANLAQRTLTEKRREAGVEEARLRAIAEQAESDAGRRVEVAKARADEAVSAARRELEVFRCEAEGRVEEARLISDQTIAAAAMTGESAVQAETAKLRLLKNRTEINLPASAKEEAARVIAEGETEALLIRERARNELLSKKAALLKEYGDQAAAMLFLKQKLPALFAAYHQATAGSTVERLVAMDDPDGFAGAVNRGPRAFQDFLESFKTAFGVDVSALVAPSPAIKGAER